MQQVNRILNSPTASAWLKDTLTAALARDPQAASYDAEVLANALSERLDIIEARENAVLRLRAVDEDESYGVW